MQLIKSKTKIIIHIFKNVDQFIAESIETENSEKLHIYFIHYITFATNFVVVYVINKLFISLIFLKICKSQGVPSTLCQNHSLFLIK